MCHAAATAVSGRPSGRCPADRVLERRARSICLQYLERGDSQRRRALHGGGGGRGHVRRILRHQIVRRAPTARVLLLDAGRFLVSEPVQNLANIGFNVPSPIPPSSDPGTPRELVWGIPWRGDTDFPGLAYCTGGKSIYWGGWCPRLTAGDLAQWPAATAQYLVEHSIDVESGIGVVPATDFIFGELGDVLRDACVSAAAVTPDIDSSIGASGVETAPLAVQGSPPVSGLFSFDKYSSLPILVDAIRADAGASGGNDAARRLFLVPLAHVVKLHAAGGHSAHNRSRGGRPTPVPAARARHRGRARRQRRRNHAARADIFPTPLMGRNLMAHLRSDFTVRVKRTALGRCPRTCRRRRSWFAVSLRPADSTCRSLPPPISRAPTNCCFA